MPKVLETLLLCFGYYILSPATNLFLSNCDYRYIIVCTDIEGCSKGSTRGGASLPSLTLWTHCSDSGCLREHV